MSIHKLTAGSGYDYLTRQVAALDATDKGHTGLASYYTEKGGTPGIWVGSGMASIDGLNAGDVVTADQMQALFGAGHHPLAEERIKELDLRIGRPVLPRPTDADYKAAVRLGAPYKVYENDVSAFRIEVAKRVAAVNQADGLPGDWPVPAAVRAKIRTDVATEFFRTEHGRNPADARELAATIAKHSRPKTTAVAGYDLTFSPVKSFSALWALADPATAAKLETAHNLAVSDALQFIEKRALFTRQGTNGVRQVNVRGLLGTAFTHRDSRAGDPDLHTHVAVANKVQTLDGKWLAIDGRLMFKAVVAASEVYNTRLEAHARDLLGVQFAERPNPDARKRPVREIVGVHPDINTRFSKRRASVEDRRQVLATEFQRTHGRPPSPIETIQLAQQATLETREAKHEPRSLAEQRAVWHTEAVGVFGGGIHGARRLQQMIHGALHPEPAPALPADAKWFVETADRITAAMEGRRATWQVWHVHAEAQRQLRTALGPGRIPTDQIDAVVDLLVSEVLDGRSISLARNPTDATDHPDSGLIEPVEPPDLRRVDGASVYTVAGADLYTSSRVLAAEERLVVAAGRRDGYAVDETCVDLALLESAANGITLNAGQAALVRGMATSGARVQLAIAPAGSGKTTAMRALAQAWSEGGGTVIGLAPSAAAAEALRTSMGSQLGTETGNQTDTLAKLVHTLVDPSGQAKPPAWFTAIGPATLVVIDEAGMADTLSLDIATQHILQRGGSVRLVGDDQQLGAIGAGGVLRDIRATHGALHLTELVRFADTAEGAASLALREGKPEALGFYLDHDRVHVGGLSTMTEDVFSAWQADRANALDSIMLAPNRELVSQLNQQARAHRLQGADDPRRIGAVRRLADGNDASVGELIITRQNDRRLRASATDWVKNGDRWTILAVHSGGDLTVQHTRHGRAVRLPSEYIARSVELGYACTINGAQGVTADTMHGLTTGTESRQQLYTMLTRGAIANHLYLQTIGDGDPHSVIHPALVHPLTPTDILESALARDEAPRSASSLLTDQSAPGLRLGDATARYTDSLYVAAEHVLRTSGTRNTDGLDVVDALDTIVPGLSEEPAWPALRAHLLLLGAQGLDPIGQLQAVATERELDSTGDRAAVLDWRLDDSGLRSAGTGPLPWLPGIPEQLAQDSHWGEYLTQRAALVRGLADQVRNRSLEPSSLPGWAQNGIRPDESTIADVEVWRAATQVQVEDRRPTGPPQLQKAAATWQRRLNRRVTASRSPALAEWSQLLHAFAPQISFDDFTPMLAERLATMSRNGIAASQLLRTAAAGRPLPDEHAAAALWWRMARHLTPAVAAELSDPRHGVHLNTGWTSQLNDLLGAERADRVQASNWWPALVTNIDHGLARGWQLEDLLAGNSPDTDGTSGDPERVDECQVLVWRTSIALVPVPDEYADDYWFDPPPEDLWDGTPPPPAEHTEPSDVPEAVPLEPIAEPWDIDLDGDQYIEGDLTVAALLRSSMVGVPHEDTEADIRRMFQRAEDWDYSPVTRERMLQINELTQAFFAERFTNSWGRDHLASRFGVDLAGHEHFQPGHAPAGWTNLVTHLRRHGFTDTEMLTTGVATAASTGHLIDRFRDRVMFPITATSSHSSGSHGTEILGFVGRRHPDLTEADKAGPKYLNTADTPLFHKGDQLFGIIDELVTDGAIPVIVEGPMDAIAVTLASAGRYVGVAPLGTSLTDQQATQLGAIGRDPLVATDADLAGQVAAERAFWMLAPHGLDPGYARFPTSMDPAELLTLRGPAALVGSLTSASPLGDLLLSERLDNLPPERDQLAAIKIVAARPATTWDADTSRIQARLGLPQLHARRSLRDAVHTWDADPRGVAAGQLNDSSQVRARLAAAAARNPADRWAPLAAELDPRLVAQPDWPATATIFQEAHDQGHDVATAIRALLAERPLGQQPARDLRYRIVSRLDVSIENPELPSPGSPPGSQGAARARQRSTPNHPTLGHRPRR